MTADTEQVMLSRAHVKIGELTRDNEKWRNRAGVRGWALALSMALNAAFGWALVRGWL